MVIEHWSEAMVLLGFAVAMSSTVVAAVQTVLEIAYPNVGWKRRAGHQVNRSVFVTSVTMAAVGLLIVGFNGGA